MIPASVFGLLARARTVAWGVVVCVVASSLPAVAGKIYWQDVDGGGLRRADPDGSNVETIVSAEVVAGIALDSVTPKLYWRGKSLAGLWGIHRADPDGTDVETILELPSVTSGTIVAVDPRAQKVYWNTVVSGASSLFRADLDGSNIEAIELHHPGLGTIRPFALALDVAGGRMYVTQGVGSSDSIYRSNLDGSDVELLVNDGEGAGGIALDLLHGKMYYTDLENGVRRRNLDGSSPQSVSQGSQSLGTLDVALDLGAGQLYFSSWYGIAGIWRGELDGSNLGLWLPGVQAYVLDVLHDPFFCGDGVVNPGEACDDANLVSGDGCEPDCTETEPVPVPAVSRGGSLAAALLVLIAATAVFLHRRRSTAGAR